MQVSIIMIMCTDWIDDCIAEHIYFRFGKLLLYFFKRTDADDPYVFRINHLRLALVISDAEPDLLSPNTKSNRRVIANVFSNSKAYFSQLRP